MKSRKSTKTTPILGFDIKRKHPAYFGSCPTDIEYALIARKIYNILNESDILPTNIDLKEMAITLTLYMEDIVSFGGTWKSFNRLCKSLYNRDLPFYTHELYADKDCKESIEYIEDEVNLEDICFLIWMKAQQVSDSTFINPENPGIMLLANEIFNFMLDNFEKVPINPAFEKLYTINIKDDYQRFCFYRDTIHWIFCDNYLLSRVDAEDKIIKLSEQLEDLFPKTDTNILDYSANVTEIFINTCGPLSLFPNQWLAAMLATSAMITDAVKRDIKCLAELKFRSFQPYNIMSVKEDVISVTDMNDDEIRISTSSLNNTATYAENDTIMSAIVKFEKDAWYVNGLCTTLSHKLDLKQYKNDIQSKKFGKELKETETPGTLDTISKAIGGKRYGFFDNALALAKTMMPKEQLRNPSPELEATLKETDAESPVFAYVCNDGTMYISPILAEIIPDKENKYYIQSDTEQSDILSVLTDAEDIPAEVVDFLIKKKWLKKGYLNSIHGKKHGQQLLQNNLDFISRMFKQDPYYAHNTLTDGV